MALPSDYSWTYWKGGYVPFSYPKAYYTVYVNSIYGESIAKFDIEMYSNTNMSDDKISLSNKTGLALSNYGRRIIDKPKLVDTSLYEKVYTGNNARFTPSYYNSKTYNGKKLGRYLRSEKTYEYGTSGDKGDEYIYYYENGLVSVYDIARIAEFTIPIHNVEIDYISTTGHEVYMKKDTRTPTNCCIKYLCNPTKYKKA